MNKRILEIIYCNDCAHLLRNLDTSLPFCWLSNRKPIPVDHIREGFLPIPDWCPLPTPPETKTPG